MMRFVPVPIDERAAAAARRSRNLGAGASRPTYRPAAREVDTALWSGILFWFGFTLLAVIAGL